MSKVSIITPFKNTSKYIVQTAKSIFEQSHTDWEWILVNDHSDENEMFLLQDFLSDKRVLLLQNKGKGIIDALLTAQDAISGEYITRMDADDIMPVNKLELFLDQFSKKDINVVTGKINYFSDDDLISEGYKKYEAWLNNIIDTNTFYKEIYRECTISSGNWMISVDDFKSIGGFNNLNYPEDYDLLFKFYKHGLKLKGISEITHLWRDHSSRTSKNSEHYNQKYFFKLKINRLIELEDLSMPIILNGCGQKSRLCAKILIDNKITFTWVSHEPDKYKAGVLGQKIHSIEYASNISSLKIFIINTTLLEDNILLALYKRDLNNCRIISV